MERYWGMIIGKQRDKYCTNNV